MNVRVAVAGANGRLGRVMCEVVEEHPGVTLSAQLGRNSPAADWETADLIIEATHPEVSPRIVQDALRRGQRVIVGTSGWSATKLEELGEWVHSSPGASVLVVPNFSLGSVLGTHLAKIAAPFFDAVEILESHHPHKVDSPSGTAVHTAEEISRAREQTPLTPPFAEQEARGETIEGVPIHSMRLRGVVASQEIRFGGVGETLTISHDTKSADSYRAGIRAAIDYVLEHDGLTVGLATVLGVAS